MRPRVSLPSPSCSHRPAPAPATATSTPRTPFLSKPCHTEFRLAVSTDCFKSGFGPDNQICTINTPFSPVPLLYKPASRLRWNSRQKILFPAFSKRSIFSLIRLHIRYYLLMPPSVYNIRGGGFIYPGGGVLPSLRVTKV